MWTFRHRTRRLPAGRTLRLIVPTPAIVRWTADGWTNSGEVATTALSFGGLHYLDLDTAGLAIGAQVEWRFFWPEGNRLESGEKFRVEVV
jgi:glucoamylase